ncbi:unnamed protein product [Camellia sinensis]
MPSIISNELNDTKSIKISDIRSNGDSTLRKRRLRSDSAAEDGTKSKSPRRCINGGLNCTENGIIEKESGGNKSEDEKKRVFEFCKQCMEQEKAGSLYVCGCPGTGKSLLMERVKDSLVNWAQGDAVQLSAVKEALHVSTAPHTVVCREDEKKRVLEFCKQCIEQEKAGSLYVCGCPGTGKSLLMERVKDSLVYWAQGAGFQPPDVLAINCTSLTNTSEIFNTWKKSTPEESQKFYFTIKASSEFVLAKAAINWPEDDRIANAIDLADRFLPRLQSLSCKPMMVTFRAYSKDQIIMILQRRLMALPYVVFQPQALELCARKVAAASGDMRKALCICRSAIEMLQAELRESACNLDFSLVENGYSNQQTTPACDLIKQGIDIVRVDHMAIALSKTYRSPIMDTIQSLPQHQQHYTLFCCEAFPWGKEGYNYRRGILADILSKSYLDICKLTLIPPVGIMELSSMCRVLGDQGLLKLGQSREDKLRRVTLKVDEADVAFALQEFVSFEIALMLVSRIWPCDCYFCLVLVAVPFSVMWML